MKKLSIFILTALIILVATSCGTGNSKSNNPYNEMETKSASGYETMSEYEGEDFLVDTTVLEIKEFMENKDTFVFLAAYENCPFCNRAMPYIAKMAEEYGMKIGYLDTRKDPSWQNNLDIDDYDTFVELFGEYLDLDDNNIPHLYVPDMYFIKNGKVVGNCTCSVTGGEDPAKALSQEQEQELIDNLKECFDKL